MPTTNKLNRASQPHRRRGGRRTDLPRCRWAVAGHEPTRRDNQQHTRRHRCGGRRRDLPRCRWAVAGLGRATRRHPDRLEAAARPARPGRASRSTTPSRRLACGDLAGGQATRRPEIRRGAATPEIRRSHKQPGPTGHSPASDQRLTGTQRLAHSVVTSARAGRCAALEAASTRSTASSMTGTPSTGV